MLITFLNKELIDIKKIIVKRLELLNEEEK